MSHCLSPNRPGLAGGIDRDGSRAAELLTLGFGSVEFGTVSPLAEAGRHGGVAMLAQRLAALVKRQQAGVERCLIGIGLGLGTGAPAAALASHWLAGMRAAWPVADYLSFNLSAVAHQPLLAAQHAPLLKHALSSVAIERERLSAASGRRVALALKLPLSQQQAAPAAAQLALALGFETLIAVLPDCPQRWSCLQALARHMKPGEQLLAVGGIRNGADVRTALQAGASGVQVHRVFLEQGAACLPALLSGFPPSRSYSLAAVAGS